MLPKKYRLPLRTEFTRIKKNGRLIQGKTASLLVFNRKDNLISRFGAIVSNKIAKKATQRNYIRRLLAESIYRKLPKIKAGFDAIFLVKKSIIGKKLAEVEKEVEILFHQAGII